MQNDEIKNESQLRDQQIREMIGRIKSGDQSVWDDLLQFCEKDIQSRVWKVGMRGIDEASGIDRTRLQEDLMQAGTIGFFKAVRKFDPERNNMFMTFAIYDIDGEIRDERRNQLNHLGLAGMSYKRRVHKQSALSLENDPEIVNMILAKDHSDEEGGTVLNPSPDCGKYSPDRLALQILEILKKVTDEDHRLTKTQLTRLLNLYQRAKYDNGHQIADNTVTKTINGIMAELNPEEWTKENDRDFKIKYTGYQENRQKAKLNKEGKKVDVTGFSYVHTFTYRELNQLIPLICLSEMLSREDKTELVRKLVDTASTYYNTPFWSDNHLEYNTGAIVSNRIGAGTNDSLERFRTNLVQVQKAVNSLSKIRFRFNQYNESKEMIPKSDHYHVLSPYHLVIYHDNYYCIGLLEGDETKRIRHYRVDLMSDVELVKQKIDVTNFEGLPIFNPNWDAEKYMAEHLYMGYDEPQDIRIKIRNDDYTILHDWFGAHYEKTNESCEEGYDIVKVRTSPFMIVRWALQYGTNVEIMDEEIRDEVRKELERLEEMYGNRQKIDT